MLLFLLLLSDFLFVFEIERSFIGKLKEKARRVNTEVWKLEMENKETMRLYRMYKNSVSEINCMTIQTKTKF